MGIKEELNTYLEEVSQKILQTDYDKLTQIAEVLVALKKRGGTLFTMGNGGSSATASHMVNDFVKGCRVNGNPGFRAYCLSDSSALVTCLANDFCYEDIYKIQIETYGKKDDVLAFYTGSGNSENLVRAAKFAQDLGIITMGFLGRDGGKSLSLCDYSIIAPSDNMEQIEDLHLCYQHALTSIVRGYI